ncbi:MAG: ABC transporter ATP-binding protein [Candidatus Eiseniibacteriota bacterium]
MKLPFRFRRPGGALRVDSLAATYVRFWPILRKSPGILAGAFGSMMAYAVLEILRPWPLKVVVDSLLSQGAGVTIPWIGTVGPERAVLLASGAILIIAALAGVAAYGESYLGAKAGQLLAFRLRRDLFRHVHRLSLSFHDRARTGDLVLRLTGDMNLVNNLLVASTLKLLSQGLVVVGVVGLLFWLDRTIALVALSIFPLLLLTASRFSRRIKTAVRKQRRRESEIAARSAESLGSVAVVKIHGAEDEERERFLASHRRSLRQGLRATKLQAALERRVELLVALGTCAVLWVGARRALHGDITAGDLVLAVAYLGLAYKPMRSFSKLTGRLAKGVVAAERIGDVLAQAPEELHAPGALRPEPILGRLELKDVRFGYRQGEEVLRGVTLTIDAGERIALVGRSGAGKTTFARLLPRLYEPTGGQVLLDGIPLREIELAHLRDHVSFVLQETVLLGISIWDNITYGLEDLAVEDVERAARHAGIHERIGRLPAGYDTILDEHGRGLSGGERQRIALARAFVRQTPIVVLDEPDTFLDAAVRENLWEAIHELTKGRTSICIVHDVGNARFADRIVVLDEGRVAGQGAHEELLASCEVYRDLWIANARRRRELRAS